MEEKKIKNIRKKITAASDTKIEQKKSTMPTRIFFLLCRKKCVICTDREECEKKMKIFICSIKT